jgi:hypothetical protein
MLPLDLHRGVDDSPDDGRQNIQPLWGDLFKQFFWLGTIDGVGHGSLLICGGNSQDSPWPTCQKLQKQHYNIP